MPDEINTSTKAVNTLADRLNKSATSEDDPKHSYAEMLRTLVAERDAAIKRELSLKDTTEELRQCQRELNAIKRERNYLREQVKNHRNERNDNESY